MDRDAVKTRDQDNMHLDFGIQIEEMLKEQVSSLESKIRLQLEEKALAWVEEECKKRLKTFRENIREEIQREVETWVEGELARRMEEFKRRNDKL
jgi:hypothetical protein